MIFQRSHWLGMVFSLSLFAVCRADEPKAPAKPNPNPANEAALSMEATVESELSNRRLREEAEAWLRLPTDADFVEAKLEEVIHYLADQHKARIRIDHNAIELSQTSNPITLSASGRPLSHVLNIAIQAADLAWTIRQGDIVVTTIQNIPRETRVYRLGRLRQLESKRLLPPGSATSAGMLSPNGHPSGGFSTPSTSDEPHHIVRVLQEEIDAPWRDVDGEGGTLSLFGEMLVVRHTYHAHEQIGDLLKAVEAALAREPGSPSLLVMQPVEAQRFLAAQKGLRRELKLKLMLTPLNEFVKTLVTQTDLEIVVDHAALASANISESIELNLLEGQYPAHQALQIALKPAALIAVIDEGAIRITTPERAEKFYLTVVYDIADLVRSEEDVQPLIQLFQESAGGPWKDTDGEGGTLTELPGGLFVIRQSDSVHTQIALLLHELRQAKKESLKDNAKPAAIDVEKRFYKAKSKDEAEALERLILTFVAPNTWDVSGGKGLLRIAEDRLIIQQTKVVHDQIDSFLRDYQQAKPIGTAVK